jgi:hypothetical protein
MTFFPGKGIDKFHKRRNDRVEFEVLHSFSYIVNKPVPGPGHIQGFTAPEGIVPQVPVNQIPDFFQETINADDTGIRPPFIRLSPKALKN